eukprot:Nk52_evm23s2309 gene=Nk52_evmTU23s2309
MNSGVCADVNKVLAFNGIPHISASCSSPSLSDRATYPSFIRTVPSEVASVLTVLAMCKHFKWVKVGVVYQSDDFGTPIFEAYRSNAAKYGVNINENAIVSLPANIASLNIDVSSQVDQLRQSGVNIILMVVPLDNLVAFFDSAERAGIAGVEGRVYVGDFSWAGLLVDTAAKTKLGADRFDKIVRGLIIPDLIADESSAEYSIFATNYRSYTGDTTTSLPSLLPTWAYFWDAAKWSLEALNLAVKALQDIGIDPLCLKESHYKANPTTCQISTAVRDGIFDTANCTSQLSTASCTKRLGVVKTMEYRKAASTDKYGILARKPSIVYLNALYEHTIIGASGPFSVDENGDRIGLFTIKNAQYNTAKGEFEWISTARVQNDVFTATSGTEFVFPGGSNTAPNKVVPDGGTVAVTSGASSNDDLPMWIFILLGVAGILIILLLVFLTLAYGKKRHKAAVDRMEWRIYAQDIVFHDWEEVKKTEVTNHMISMLGFGTKEFGVQNEEKSVDSPRTQARKRKMRAMDQPACVYQGSTYMVEYLKGKRDLPVKRDKRLRECLYRRFQAGLPHDPHSVNVVKMIGVCLNNVADHYQSKGTNSGNNNTNNTVPNSYSMQSKSEHMGEEGDNSRDSGNPNNVEDALKDIPGGALCDINSGGLYTNCCFLFQFCDRGSLAYILRGSEQAEDISGGGFAGYRPSSANSSGRGSAHGIAFGGGGAFQTAAGAITMDWVLASSLCRDIADGLQFVHDHFDLHGQLNSHNVLVDQRWIAKVTGFGMNYLNSQYTAVAEAEVFYGLEGAKKKSMTGSNMKKASGFMHSALSLRQKLSLGRNHLSSSAISTASSSLSFENNGMGYYEMEDELPSSIKERKLWVAPENIPYVHLLRSRMGGYVNMNMFSGHAGDVYSLGCILLEIITGEKPFQEELRYVGSEEQNEIKDLEKETVLDNEAKELIDQKLFLIQEKGVTVNFEKYAQEMVSRAPKALLVLVKRCLEYNPQQRCTLKFVRDKLRKLHDHGLREAGKDRERGGSRTSSYALGASRRRFSVNNVNSAAGGHSIQDKLEVYQVELEARLEREREVHYQMLRSMYPPTIADGLMAGQMAHPVTIPSCTVAIVAVQWAMNNIQNGNIDTVVKQINSMMETREHVLGPFRHLINEVTSIRHLSSPSSSPTSPQITQNEQYTTEKFIYVSGLPEFTAVHASQMIQFAIQLANTLPSDKYTLKIAIQTGSLSGSLVGLPLPRYAVSGPALDDANRIVNWLISREQSAAATMKIVCGDKCKENAEKERDGGETEEQLFGNKSSIEQQEEEEEEEEEGGGNEKKEPISYWEIHCSK